MRNIRLVVSTSVITAFLFIPLLSTAAPNYTVTPFVIDKDVKPRDIFTEIITIRHIGGEPTTIFPTVNNISLNEEGGIETFVSPSMSDRTSSLASWLEIGRKGIELRPGDTREVPLMFRINPNAAEGVYHALVGFGYGRNADEASKLALNKRAPGIIVTVTIERERSEFMKLSGFLIRTFIIDSGAEGITYNIENTGSEILIPQGEVLISNSRGEEVGSVVINPNKREVQPGEAAQFIADVPTSGLLGKYKAFLSVEYGTQQRAAVQDTAFFYVLPWKQIGTVFAVIVILTVVASLIMHKRYFADEDDFDEDDADYVPVGFRDTVSIPKSHDIDMKQS